jgi:alpha-mannosidase
MHQGTKAVEERLDRFFRDKLQPAIYRDHVELSITAWQAPREPVPFEMAVNQQYEAVNLGWRFGRAWSTIWLKVSGSIPESWSANQEKSLAAEIVIDFGYNTSRSGFQAEALAYDLAGKPIKAIAPKNSWLPWSYANKKVEFYLEVAANPDVAGEYTFEPTTLGDWDTASEQPLYELKKLHIARRDIEVWELVQDIFTLRGLMVSLPQDSTRRHVVTRAIEDMLDAIDPSDVSGTASAARKKLTAALSAPASASSHRVIATGHAHIDSAWLWPIRETVRKCARTFSNVLSLMDEHEDFIFSASSAQHYKWIKDHYPSVFEGIKKRVASGQWKPVGGMWVECDGNMPGSEAMVRQFVYGQKFFQDNFAMHAREAWLPDSFGYSGSLPQIVTQSGISSFLSQKMSWNQVNRMPHHTFWWEGIDGTRVFSHFPSADTYISELSGEELAHAEKNFSEKGRSSVSLVPFGWGDGGGGPTREMIAAAHRTGDLEGSPKVSMGTADEFFAQARSEYANAPVWRGEMYLELHRGVLTSQHRTKQGNRRNEGLLREAELWASYATLKTGAAYPAGQLEEIWQSILLMQFHDILPGTAIAWVYKEVENRHAEITRELIEIVNSSLAALANDPSATTAPQPLTANAMSVSRNGVAGLGVGVPSKLARATSIVEQNDFVILENEELRVRVDRSGRILSLLSLATNREAIAPGIAANELHLHNDNPTRWDAWDIDEHYRNSKQVLDTVDEFSVRQEADGAAVIETKRVLHSASQQASTIVQTIRLEPGSKSIDIGFEIDWHENEKLLKLAFPIDIHAEEVAAETQFGFVKRPTHENTSWDFARFESCQQKYLFLNEKDWGVAFANDSTYGFDVQRTTEANGATVTSVRFSLLRSTKFPDPEADLGTHSMNFKIHPAATIEDAVNLGYELNNPAREVQGNRPVEPLVTSSAAQVIIETVKLAEDGSGDLIVRLYESTGGRADSRIAFAGVAEKIWLTDFLELPTSAEQVSGGSIDLQFRPFQVITLRISGLQID